MKRLLCSFAIVAALASPARAATCSDGMVVIDQMTQILQLSETEQTNISALLSRARLEDERGHQRSCKVILADAIRFFLIKTVLDD
ncbi:hypothetical protein KKP04_01035 [Rhodomicrobium sp. Az07]|uniref:hypothetical protein n=1 Tax=Rhodomicrobium sp. Az07 TaxID=2839034 RepID=UPI001BE54B4A|nr:hypothetical protein [Rhodomicrobium sp. Az07]MBT3069454.1 hypothetical protein [Rhodomicrobium sp. Az07]